MVQISGLSPLTTSFNLISKYLIKCPLCDLVTEPLLVAVVPGLLWLPDFHGVDRAWFESVITTGVSMFTRLLW